MSYYPRQDLQNKLLGRQLAVTFSCIAWLVIATATLVGIGFCLYHALQGYGLLPVTPEAAAASQRSLISYLVLTVPGTFATVGLFFYIRKHLPANFQKIDDLTTQLNKS